MRLLAGAVGRIPIISNSVKNINTSIIFLKGTAGCDRILVGTRSIIVGRNRRVDNTVGRGDGQTRINSYQRWKDNINRRTSSSLLMFLRISASLPMLSSSYRWSSSTSRKSLTCFGNFRGLPLTEYNTLEDAADGASFVNLRNGTCGSKDPDRLVPYQCNVCGRAHLSPAWRRTASVPSNRQGGCSCRWSISDDVCDKEYTFGDVVEDGSLSGESTRYKKSYTSRIDAERRAGIIRADGGPYLVAYSCPRGDGFHLSRPLRIGRDGRRVNGRRQ